MKRLTRACLLRSSLAAAAAASLPTAASSLYTPTLAQPFRHAGTQRRHVRPTEGDVADLMDDDEDDAALSPGAATHKKAEPQMLSTLVASASLYRKVAQEDAATTKREGLRAAQKDSTQGEAVSAVSHTEDASEEANAPAHNAGDVAGASEGEVEREMQGLLSHRSEEEAAYVAEQQRVLYEMSVTQLTDHVCAYLRSSNNTALVSALEEHAIFPVVKDRFHEFHLTQLLDMAECRWSRSSMLRYGTDFLDSVRDRIAQLATAAATKLETKKQQSASRTAGFGQRGGADADTLPEEDEDGEEASIFVAGASAFTPPAPPADPILAEADKEITAVTIYRALVVTGMGAGRRKRDLAFFQLLGNYFTYFINDYTDPNDLVRVMTALARAKIVPSPAFLSLLARRLPVLHKRVPLEPVLAYRAMSNFARMGHTSMNTFRFLADCMYGFMEKNLREEKKQLRQKRRAAAAAGESANGETTTAAPPSPAPTQTVQLTADVAAKERLRRISGLRPSTFTRLLFILARSSAPHQQYLRPLIDPVIVPMLPYFPPPSFTRLVHASRCFHTNDAALVEAMVAHVCDTLAPAGKLTRTDILGLLQLLSLEDTPVPANLDRFLCVCCDVLKSSTTAASARQTGDDADTLSSSSSSPSSPSSPGQDHRRAAPGKVTFVLRPQHMHRVVRDIGGFQSRLDIPLETLAPLTELVEDFARHLAFLMELSVVSLSQVEEFVELCTRYQIPDPSGAIESLDTRRQHFMAHPQPAAATATSGGAAVDVDAAAEVEEDYYGQLDVDVRETFLKIFVANDFNTYGGYRPLPGPMQVDFRDELTKVSAFELLQAVDLFEKACPGALRKTPRLFLSRSLLEKVGKEGEVVVEEESNELIIRQPRAELLTRDDLQSFVELVQRTPLEAVRDAPAMWVFIKEKAERLHMTAIEDTASQRLEELRAGR